MFEPTTEEALSEAIKSANGPLAIRGGGTRTSHHVGEVLSVAGLSGITLYEPGALTVVAQAGTPLAEVEATLAEANQRLAFEPMDHRGLLGTSGTPTIGGVIAANVSGPRRIQSGAARDFLLGVRFVDGRGDIIKNGGRVMKNVTGYDLVKLMAGSHGTLGAISEVSLKVLPRTATQAGLEIADLSDADAVKAMSRALGSPFEVTGAAHLPGHDGAAPRTLIRIEGFEASVAYRVGELEKLLSPFGTVRVERDAKAVVATWQNIRDVLPFHGTTQDVWRISVKPSDGPGVVERLGSAQAFYDWGGGLIWAATAPGTDLRAQMGDIPGHATLVRAAPETMARLGTFHLEPAPLAQISKGLRAQFDPRGLWSPEAAA